MLAVGAPWTARAEVKLGNEVLAARHFKVLQGKRVVKTIVVPGRMVNFVAK